MVRGILETMTSVPDLNIYHCQNKGFQKQILKYATLSNTVACSLNVHVYI